MVEDGPEDRSGAVEPESFRAPGPGRGEHRQGEHLVLEGDGGLEPGDEGGEVAAQEVRERERGEDEAEVQEKERALQLPVVCHWPCLVRPYRSGPPASEAPLARQALKNVSKGTSWGARP
jgi:hypothetical protein